MDNQNKKDEKVKSEDQNTTGTSEASSEEPLMASEPAATPADTSAAPAEPQTPAETAEQSPAVEAPADASEDMSSEPSPQPIATDAGYTETKSSKLVNILVGLLLVILLSLVGLFFYKQMMTAPAENSGLPTPVQASPTVAVSPTVTPANEEEAELQQIEIPDIDQDLQQIETDLDQL